MTEKREFVITLDTDWAPDFIVDEVAAILLNHRVPATWFITNNSPAVDRLRSHLDLFELGIHPNFNDGSTHGGTISEVLSHCQDMLPDAQSMRTHGLVQSTFLLWKVMKETSLSTDVSLYLHDYPFVTPFEYAMGDRTLLRIPYIWEDDVHFSQSKPSWELDQFCQTGEGVRVVNFHPIHVYLNSQDIRSYTALKEAAGGIAVARPDQVASFVASGPGTGTLFRQFVAYAASNHTTKRICDIHDEWMQARGHGSS